MNSKEKECFETFYLVKSSRQVSDFVSATGFGDRFASQSTEKAIKWCIVVVELPQALWA